MNLMLATAKNIIHPNATTIAGVEVRNIRIVTKANRIQNGT